MKRAVLIYNLLILSVFITAGLIQAKSFQDVISALLFAPPLLYITRLLIGNLNISFSQSPDTNTQGTNSLALQSQSLSTRHQALDTDHQALENTDQAIEPEIISDPGVADINRRLFLKLVGGASLSVLMMSFFTDQSHAAFFGSMPVPGAMTLKDSTGLAIDPAEKQPTDGYEISEIDDVDTPAYYGFVHKTGAWYISREADNGSYRYVKGLSDFPTAWTGRTALTYDYYDNVF